MLAAVSRSAVQLLTLVVVTMVMLDRCSGLYRDQRVVLSRGVRGYISCPALAEPPATLIVWTRNGQVGIQSARSLVVSLHFASLYLPSNSKYKYNVYNMQLTAVWEAAATHEVR